MLVVTSESLDPFVHLAAEELLLERVENSGPILFFWRSRKAVVIGKNQNPWKECRWRPFLEQGGVLARRISGGGTVYQDEGNLNYCWMVKRETYEADQPFNIVLEALNALGIAAKRLGKSSIGAGEQKFSGNAFCLRKGTAMHHGTLLVNADMAELHRVLELNPMHLQSHAVDSVPAKTVNLTQLNPAITMDVLAANLTEVFARHARVEHPGEESLGILDASRLEEATEKHRSEGWLFDQTPRFSIEVPQAGLFEVHRGAVTGFSPGNSDLEEGQFMGCRFNREGLAEKCRGEKDADIIRQHLHSDWF